MELLSIVPLLQFDFRGGRVDSVTVPALTVPFEPTVLGLQPSATPTELSGCGNATITFNMTWSRMPRRLVFGTPMLSRRLRQQRRARLLCNFPQYVTALSWPSILFLSTSMNSLSDVGITLDLVGVLYEYFDDALVVRACMGGLQIRLTVVADVTCCVCVFWCDGTLRGRCSARKSPKAALGAWSSGSPVTCTRGAT
jgi:hypothetical protein